MKRIALLIFLTLAFFSPGRLTVSDAGNRLLISRALWRHATVFVSRDQTNWHSMVPSPHDVNLGTSFYGIGQTLLFIPFDIMGYAMAKVITPSPVKPAWVETLPIVFLYAPLMGLLLWLAMFYLLRRLDYSKRTSYVASSLVLFGTTTLIYSVGLLQEEVPIAILLCSGLVLSLKYLENRNRRDLFIAALLWSCTALFRLNVLFAFLPLFGLLADRIRQGKSEPLDGKCILLTLVYGMIPPLLLYTAFSYWRFGGCFANGYAKLENGIVLIPVQIHLAFALLIGPGKGLFLLSPLLLVALEGMRRDCRRYLLFSSGLAVAFIVSCLVYSRLSGAAFPDGSESWGNRFHLHLIFLFVIGVGSFIERCRFRLVAKTLVLTSILLQVISCWAPDSLDAFFYPGELEYNRRQRLLMGADDGQLAQRIKTITYSFTGNYPRLWINSESKQRMVSEYVPNFWGPVYYKKLGRGPLAITMLLLWLTLLPLAAALAYGPLRTSGMFFGFRGRSPE